MHEAKEGMAQRLSCRLYAVMSNQRGMAQLLSLWNNWVANPQKRATTGFGPFKDVFIHLKDIRRWSPQDRLERTGVLDYWQQYLQQKQGPIKFEVELWCRGSGEVRQRAYDNLQSLVGEASGKCVRETQIPEICYHGVLAELPPHSLHETINHILQNEYSQLLRCEDVMFFRPFGQSGFPVEEADDPPPGSASGERAGHRGCCRTGGRPARRPAARKSRPPGGPPDCRRSRRLQVRFLGYGEVDPQRTLVSTEQRATIIGWGRLTREKARVFEVPLPPCLTRQQGETAAYGNVGVVLTDQHSTPELPPSPALVSPERRRTWRQQGRS